MSKCAVIVTAIFAAIGMGAWFLGRLIHYLFGLEYGMAAIGVLGLAGVYALAVFVERTR